MARIHLAKPIKTRPLRRPAVKVEPEDLPEATAAEAAEPAEEMPLGIVLEAETFGAGLSSKQLAFANLLLEGRDIVEAFKEAFAWKIKNKALIPRKAREAFMRPELQRYLQNQLLIRAHPGYGKQLISREEWLKLIKALADEAREDKKYSAAVSALELYGKAERWLGAEASTGDSLELAMWTRWIERGIRAIEDAPGHLQEALQKRLPPAIIVEAVHGNGQSA